MNGYKHRGFTLIELMMVLVVAGVLLSLAVPSFQQFRTNQQIRLTGQSLQGAFQLARAEAIKRKTTVYITANGNWQSGWFISTLSSRVYADCAKAAPETDCIQVFEGNNQTSIVATGITTQASYTRTGRPGTGGITFTVCDDDLSSEYTQRIISIGTNGMPTTSYGGNCS